jgi:hypothetical protein
MLFDSSLGEDTSWQKPTTAHAAHTQHKRMLNDETVIGSLAVMPTVVGEADGVLAHAPSRGRVEADGVLAQLPMSNPDGVLAVYGNTGEYVEKMQLKSENEKLEKLQVLEHEAALLQDAQTKKLANLEKELHIQHKDILHNKPPAASTQAAAGAEPHHAAAAVRAAAKAASSKAKQVLQAAKADKAKHAVEAVAVPADKPHAAAHVVQKPQTRQQRIAAAMKHRAAQSQTQTQTQTHAAVAGKKPRAAQQHLAAVPKQNKLEEEPEAEKKPESESSEGAKNGGLPDYNDIGWVKHEWDASSWVLFVIFGPIFTIVVTGLVWGCAGPVAAIIMLIILVCLDISSYYYSWFLV